jgi:hypothetical protein
MVLTPAIGLLLESLTTVDLQDIKVHTLEKVWNMNLISILVTSIMLGQMLMELN